MSASDGQHVGHLVCILIKRLESYTRHKGSIMGKLQASISESRAHEELSHREYCSAHEKSIIPSVAVERASSRP